MIADDPNAHTIHPAARALVEEIERRVDALADRISYIVSVYAAGSVTSGGYRPDGSDIDLAVVMRDVDDPIVALADVRTIDQEIRSIHDIDITSIFERDVTRVIPCRPFIIPLAGDYGVLLYGRYAIPKNQKLDLIDVIDALAFDIREYSRVVVHGTVIDFAKATRRNIRAYWGNLSQYLRSLDPTWPFTLAFPENMYAIVARYPKLAPFTDDFIAAVHGPSSQAQIDTTLRCLVRLRDFIMCLRAETMSQPMGRSPAD